MKGFRVFGNNKGGLNHVGDFALLFAPLMDQLSTMAVYGFESDGLNLPSSIWELDIEEIDAEMEALIGYLAGLDIRPRSRTEIDGPGYYRPGFFPRFTEYIQDDWSRIVCFAPPFPDYDKLLLADYGEIPSVGRVIPSRARDVERGAWALTRFAFYFRNIDAAWWEVFSPDRAAIQLLLDHFRARRIKFQDLTFERDFPESSAPVSQ
jgi:hypothetical protein